MAENLLQIERGLRRQRKARRLAFALAAVVTSVVMVWFGLGLWHAQTARYAAPAGAIPAGATPATETRFSDGSTATALTAGAVLELERTSESELVVAAKSGSYRFDVVPNPARQFVVHVADVTVRVLGTEFVVARADHRVEVRVERGLVEVTWPSGRTELGAGQSGWFPPKPEAAVPAAAPSTVEGADAAKASTKAITTANERSRFVELSRLGNYQAAFSIVTSAPTLFESSAEDLLMAADAARLSNHPVQAVAYLQRITREHARDSRAPLAAFTLGRIYMNQMGQPASAARAFALVRQLSPTGALVEDALAREAEALEQAGQHAAAQRLAEAYLGQYPNGRSRDKLRQLGKSAKSE
jgi:transmembrane sensor